MVPALVFQKVVISYHEMRGPRMCFLLLGPPCGQQHVLIRLRGGGPKCLKICSKNHFLSEPRCVAGRGFWSKLVQIEAPLLLVPPFRPPIRRDSPPGKGGGKRLKICAKIRFLCKSQCIAGPGFSSKLIQIEASSLLGPPFRPETRRR